jgi:hypothetical protein
MLFVIAKKHDLKIAHAICICGRKILAKIKPKGIVSDSDRSLKYWPSFVESEQDSIFVVCRLTFTQGMCCFNYIDWKRIRSLYTPAFFSLCAFFYAIFILPDCII